VVTQDLDFSMLVALSGFRKPSLVTLRLACADPATITQRLLDALPRIEQQLEDGSAVTIEDASIRIRKLPIQ
jgi:predicted nuclease of predicted toxin-antitoxin system